MQNIQLFIEKQSKLMKGFDIILVDIIEEKKKKDIKNLINKIKRIEMAD